METVDVRKEVLEEVELLGQIGYFTGMRVDKETVPEGMHCYELRHGDDWGFPVSVEESSSLYERLALSRGVPGIRGGKCQG